MQRENLKKICESLCFLCESSRNSFRISQRHTKKKYEDTLRDTKGKLKKNFVNLCVSFANLREISFEFHKDTPRKTRRNAKNFQENLKNFVNLSACFAHLREIAFPNFFFVRFLSNISLNLLPYIENKLRVLKIRICYKLHLLERIRKK